MLTVRARSGRPRRCARGALVERRGGRSSLSGVGAADLAATGRPSLATVGSMSRPTSARSEAHAVHSTDSSTLTSSPGSPIILSSRRASADTDAIVRFGSRPVGRDEQRGRPVLGPALEVPRGAEPSVDQHRAAERGARQLHPPTILLREHARPVVVGEPEVVVFRQEADRRRHVGIGPRCFR